MSIRRNLLLAASSVALGAVASEAWAQANALEEVVVTAERRTTDVQRTALAITAIGGDQLARGGISDIKELTSTIPGLAVSSTSSVPNVSLRGISGSVGNSYGDPAVAYNIDGIYIARPYGSVASYFDLDRVEILNGPQGTLYGRNATVGAINVISKKPVLGEFGGDVSVQLGNYDHVELGGAINIPITDTLAARAAFKTVKHDGYLNNGYNDADNASIRLHLLWQPSEDLSVLASIDRFDQGGRGASSTWLYYFPGQKWINPSDPWDTLVPPGCGTVVLCPTQADTFGTKPVPQVAGIPIVGTDGFNDTTQDIFRLEVNWNLGFANLTLLPAYVKSDIAYANYTQGWRQFLTTDVEQVSFEGRLTSTGEGRLKWVAGFFYFEEDQSAVNTFLQGVGYFIFINPQQPDTSWAVFGQATYSLTDRLRLTAGLRYSTEEKEQVGYTQYPNVAAATCLGTQIGLPLVVNGINYCQIPNSGNLDFDSTNYKLAVEFDLAPQSLLYASVSSGFKAGGFTTGQPPNTYEPEELTAYEIGSKNRFMDNRLQVNGSIFYWDYEGQQVNQTTRVFPVFAGGFAIKPINQDGWLGGAELNIDYLLTENDRLGLSLLYEKGKYTNYRIAASPFVPGSVDRISPRDLDRANMPEWSGAFTYAHTWNLPNDSNLVFNFRTLFADEALLLAPGVNVAYRGPGTPAGVFNRPSYHVSAAELTYEAPDDAWSATVFVDNIENEPVLQTGTAGYVGTGSVYKPPNVNALYISVGPPRTYGVRFNAKF